MNGERQGPIPNRWLRCPRRAKELIIDKFIAFKTPLDDSYDDQVPLEYRFYPSMIFDVCKIKNVSNLIFTSTSTSQIKLCFHFSFRLT